MMFYLKGRGGRDTKCNESLNEDDFGWSLNDQDVSKSSICTQGKECRSSGSSSSMLSCVDSDDTESYSLAEDFRQESHESCEKIELTSIIQDDLDVDLIEKDAATNQMQEVTPIAVKHAKDVFSKLETRSQKSQAICYTPERLVRSQEYRILTPSPRYLSVPLIKVIPENENRHKARHCRRRLNYLIDSKQVGASQLKALLNLDGPEFVVVRPTRTNDTTKIDEKDTVDDSLNVTDQSQSIALQMSDSISKQSSYEGLNVTWEDCKKTTTRSSSLEDTSGIHSNDWSSDTHSDIPHTPLRLSEELAIASTNYKLHLSQERHSAINEVVSILEVLETEPDKAAVLLEEDRFCNSTSSHDQLTRLALAIETDANVPGVLEDPENLVQHLQRKVEKLQVASKDIYRDICNLRKSFQCDEERMANISSGATKLREDVHEMRYLDDLLNLLQGELERISRRKWPFVLGNAEHHSEEMNLIV